MSPFVCVTGRCSKAGIAVPRINVGTTFFVCGRVDAPSASAEEPPFRDVNDLAPFYIYLLFLPGSPFLLHVFILSSLHLSFSSLSVSFPISVLSIYNQKYVALLASKHSNLQLTICDPHSINVYSTRRRGSGTTSVQIVRLGPSKNACLSGCLVSVTRPS